VLAKEALASSDISGFSSYAYSLLMDKEGELNMNQVMDNNFFFSHFLVEKGIAKRDRDS